MTELTTIDPNNYGAMAKAMGIANESNVAEKRTFRMPSLCRTEEF